MRGKILIVYTGGTIGMKHTSNGYKPEKGYLLEMLHAIPELRHESMPELHVLEFEPLIDSSNASPSLWNDIVHAIERNYHEYSGFVILHGTDTMAFTTSAVSFLLDNLNKTVVFTGSQIPLCEIRNDARENIITSILLASNYSIRDVCLYFNGRLFKGNRITKNNVTGFDAFFSHNSPLLGSIGVEFDIHSGSNTQNLKVQTKKELFKSDIKPLFHYVLEDRSISIVHLFPGMSEFYLRSVINKEFEAIVLLSYGSGNGPTKAYMPTFRDLLKDAIDNNVIVIVASQCKKGEVLFGFYETSLKMEGAVSAGNMTMEAIIGKLHYVLSDRNSTYEQKCELFTQDLKGERSDGNSIC